MVVKTNLEFRARDANRAVEKGDLIIVIDVLRSSTSIINALANGVKSIIPTKTLKEAYELHGQHPNHLLAGERRGLKPKGFDFGNSPLEFSPEQVYGKNMIITTTSGTSALTRCREAEWVFVGAFLNAESVAKKAVDVAEKKRIDVSFVLAGEKGRFSLEDFACAGAIAERFPESKVHFSDIASAAFFAFKQMRHDLFENIMKAEHAKHLMKLGFRRDIEFACKLDILGIVPIYKDGKITVLQ